MKFRLAKEEDAPYLRNIYAPYVEKTAITFEVEVPTIEEFSDRIRNISCKYPYLVCEVEGKIAGYAYASEYRSRAAFQWDVETSIYLESHYHRQGIATALYQRLFKLLTILGYYNAYGVITLPNEGSLHLHDNFGFINAGKWHNSGYKMGKWHDVICLEKHLLPFDGVPERPKVMSQLSFSQIQNILHENE